VSITREESEDGAATITIVINGREVPYSIRATIEEQVSVLKNFYENTGNPVFVWEAIGFYNGAMSEFLKIEAAPDWPPWSDTLPEWCVKYLAKCASAVSMMSLDDTPPQKCVDQIPNVFGFKRKGWNAFHERRELRESGWIDRFYYGRREEGASAQEAMNETLERYGYENERNVRKRLAAFRKACEGK
jgi:hypothetical protein